MAAPLVFFKIMIFVDIVILLKSIFLFSRMGSRMRMAAGFLLLLFLDWGAYCTLRLSQIGSTWHIYGCTNQNIIFNSPPEPKSRIALGCQLFE